MIRKILLISVGIIVLASAIIAMTLYSEPDYPEWNPEGLQVLASADIPGATAPSVPPISFSDSISPKNLGINGLWFTDSGGRNMLLRGVNLGGSTKLPFKPYLPTWKEEGFFEHRTVSFVGRPFPLAEADEHFARLKAWGFPFLRLLITWEAVEHAGPGQYDQEYLDYLYQIARKAGEHGINVFIDPHQDVWSRFTGGDGAPGWTLEKVGMDMTTFKETGAAIVHNTEGDPFPKMVWPSNYNRYAAATMFTLFFAGDDFAPRTFVDSVPVQEYLQSHYMAAIKQVALKLKDLPNVIGFDSLNEPSTGYIGKSNLDTTGIIKTGATPSLKEGMFLAAGISRQVAVFSGGLLAQVEDSVLLNPQGVSAWKEGYEPVWRQHGVWKVNDAGEPELLQPNYFTEVNGRQVDFPNHYLKPFLKRFADTIRSVHPELVVFAEPALFSQLPDMEPGQARKFVNASHWYDAITLFTKTHNPVLSFDIATSKPLVGKKNIAEAFARQLGQVKHETEEAFGAAPTLVGEFGIPFDMDEKEAFETGDFSAQIATLERSFSALEANLLHYTLWNYTADNTNERGDQWNDEDLSIFSRDQQADLQNIYSGGRALQAAIRPYPVKVTGTPLASRFNSNTREYLLEFEAAEANGLPTEVFVPDFHYADGYRVYISGGRLEKDPGRQLLLFYPETGGKQTLAISPVEG